MVPPASHWISRVPWYSGAVRGSLSFAYETITLFGPGFPSVHSARLLPSLVYSPQPHRTEVLWFGLFRFRSPLLTESRLISLPEGT